MAKKDNEIKNPEKPKRPHVPKVTYGPKQKKDALPSKIDGNKDIPTKRVFKHKSS